MPPEPDPPGRNPFLFVVGCPRSGTTLLQRMLDNHPLVAVANDSHFITEPVVDLPIGVDPPLNDEMVAWVRTYRRIHRLGLPDAVFDEAAGRSRTYGEFVGAIYRAYGEVRGKHLAGEKTASFVRELPRLHGLFPWARMIHIIRDGRDVALSTLEWAQHGKGPSKHALWATDPVAVCALWWRRNVEAGQQDGPRLGDRLYHEVYYEDLVAAPASHLAHLTAFLGLPESAEMVTYYRGRTDRRPGLSSKKAWLPPTVGLRDWRVQMAERDRALFEALAGDLLAELGYELSVATIPPDIMRVARRCRDWWQEHEARRQLALRHPP